MHFLPNFAGQWGSAPTRRSTRKQQMPEVRMRHNTTLTTAWLVRLVTSLPCAARSMPVTTQTTLMSKPSPRAVALNPARLYSARHVNQPGIRTAEDMRAAIEVRPARRCLLRHDRSCCAASRRSLRPHGRRSCATRQLTTRRRLCASSCRRRCRAPAFLRGRVPSAHAHPFLAAPALRVHTHPRHQLAPHRITCNASLPSPAAVPQPAQPGAAPRRRRSSAAPT